MRLDWVASHLAEITALAVAHANLSWPAIVASFIIALPFGWAAHRHRVSREILVTVSGILYAVPSLALFVVLPLVIGTSVLSPINVVVAMTLYGLALQIRTTADAFDAVAVPVKEAAVAMGYSPLRRIIAVELPLAGPIILAGVRVVSASTISLVSVGALTGVQSLGTLFTTGFQRSFPTEIAAGVIGTVLLALVFDAVIVACGRVLMPWARGTAQGA